MAQTMKAWQYPVPGVIDKTLAMRIDVPQPTPQSLGPDDVLVKVDAASLNPADYKVTEFGLVARAIIAFPKTVGMDISGEVTAIGGSVADVKPGDKVIGRINPFKGQGALSEVISLPRGCISVLPPGADVITAAGIPTAALTAYQSIAPYVDQGKGDRIFINGGSGGVGSLCVQIGKLLGCHVTTSCSTGKVDLCKSLGADEIIDYKKTNVTAELVRRGQEFKLVVDNVGNSPSDLYSGSRGFLGNGRPYVFVGGNMSLPLIKNLTVAMMVPTFLGGVRGKFTAFFAKDNQKDLDQLAEWYAGGKLKILVDEVYPFQDAKVAMQRLKAGSSAGKIIVKMDG